MAHDNLIEKNHEKIFVRFNANLRYPRFKANMYNNGKVLYCWLIDPLSIKLLLDF